MTILDPSAVFDAWWGTAMEDAQFYENDAACMEGRDAEDIDGDPAAEYVERYVAAIEAVCRDAESLLAQQNLNTFPRRCPNGDIDGTFGSDLYLTAAGHGAGFWDGDWDPIGDELTAIADRHMPGGDLVEHRDGGWFLI